MLILDPTSSSRLILDPTASSRLILTVIVAATGSFRGCVNVTTAIQGVTELAPTLQSTFVIAPTFEGVLEIGVMNCSGELTCGDLLLENTTDVRLVGVKLASTFVNDATCTMTLKTSAGATVPGADGLTLTYTGTPGEYLGRLPDTLALTEDGNYSLKVKATKAGVAVGTWNSDLVAKVRAANYCS